MHKGRQPDPGLPVTRLHSDPTVDRRCGSKVRARGELWLRRRPAKPCSESKTDFSPMFTKVREMFLSKGTSDTDGCRHATNRPG